MREIIYICCAVFVLGKVVLTLSKVNDARPTAMASQSVPVQPARDQVASASTRPKGNGTAYVRLDRYNAFSTDIEIEGKRFRGVIDTGASSVVLRYEDAAAIGLFRKGQNWNRLVGTANGTGKAMAVRLNDVSIGDLTIYDVDALALSAGAVSTNLIGMTLLRRLSKFEIKPDMMILER